MKRIHIIAISVLVGFIAGVAVPAHAAIYASTEVQIKNTVYCKKFPDRCQAVSGRSIEVLETRKGVISYRFLQDNRYYTNSPFYAKWVSGNMYKGLNSTPTEEYLITLEGDYVTVVQVDPKAPFNPDTQTIESFFKVEE